jgi:hypothetical protein
MNKEAAAKYALKTFIHSQQQQHGTSNRTRQQEIELQQQQQQQQQAQKKYWWSRAKAPESILTKEEQRILKRVKSRAHFLDRGLSCCCFQIGFDGLVGKLLYRVTNASYHSNHFILGFVPVVGDFIGLMMALQLVHMCMEAQLPNELVSRMMFNIAFDFLIGLVPLAGDILDIMYKCNTKNAILLENYLLKRRSAMMKEGGHHLEMGALPNHRSAPAIVK